MSKQCELNKPIELIKSGKRIVFLHKNFKSIIEKSLKIKLKHLSGIKYIVYNNT